MKTKTTIKKTMIGLFALLAMSIILCIGAAPAMAGPVHLDSSLMHELLGTPGGLDRVSQVLESLPSGMFPELADDVVPDEGPFPDGGGWEPVFPDDVEDEAGDDGGDEAVDEEPGDDGGDEAVEEGDEAGDDGGEEPVEEEAADDGGDETADDGGDETGEDEDELPFTGGDNIPWLIGGAGVILAGALLLLGFRKGTASR
jgi:hypothetical protein